MKEIRNAQLLSIYDTVHSLLGYNPLYFGKALEVDDHQYYGVTINYFGNVYVQKGYIHTDTGLQEDWYKIEGHETELIGELYQMVNKVLLKTLKESNKRA